MFYNDMYELDLKTCNKWTKIFPRREEDQKEG